MGIRLLSYNIHACVGTDGKYSPERIREVLRDVNADVVGLQEVEQLNDAPELLPYLCEDSDWVAHAGPTMMRDTGEYGNAVLTRLPVNQLERIELSQVSREPRGALRLLLSYEHDEQQELLDIYATHLGLISSERRHQIRQLLSHMSARELQDDRLSMVILMGDLNEWNLWGRPMRWLGQHFYRRHAPATFPSWWPMFALDRIWAKPISRMNKMYVWKTVLSRRASDHLPVVMDLE